MFIKMGIFAQFEICAIYTLLGKTLDCKKISACKLIDIPHVCDDLFRYIETAKSVPDCQDGFRLS